MELTATAWGLVCAFSLGTADFIARFTSRSVGPYVAAAGMLFFGGLFATALAWGNGWTFPASPEALMFAVASGLVAALGMMAFYLALTLGQLSFVIPLAATYPIWSVLYAVIFLGLAITPIMVAAMVATLLGCWMVAAYGEVEDPHDRGDDQGDGLARAAESVTKVRTATLARRMMVAGLALTAGICLVISVYLAGPAAAVSSEMGTLAVSRFVAAVTVIGYLLARWSGPPRLTRVAALLPIQGLLDGLGIFALIMATAHIDGALGVVVSASFGVITVLLGWTLLKERILPLQWIGIALAMGGAMTLTLYD